MDFKGFLDSLGDTYTVKNILTENKNKKAVRMTHRTLGRDLFVKLVPDDPEFCRFLCGIRHRSLPEVYDIYELSDGYAVLEEFIDGTTVGEIIKTGLYNYAGAKKVMLQICDALQLMHDNGFVHRDIKPENIMIKDGGDAKLVDFDASRRFSVSKSSDTHVLGTVGYAPPEQYGVTQSDGRSDIYAAGVLLNVMLTGSHPSNKLASGHAGRIIAKCTQINPDLRYQTIEKFGRSL